MSNYTRRQFRVHNNQLAELEGIEEVREGIETIDYHVNRALAQYLDTRATSGAESAASDNGFSVR